MRAASAEVESIDQNCHGLPMNKTVCGASSEIETPVKPHRTFLHACMQKQKNPLQGPGRQTQESAPKMGQHGCFSHKLMDTNCY